MGMAAEEAGGKRNLVANEKAETQTEEAGAHYESAIEPCEPVTGEGKRQGERGGD